jgi:hypothetical protein
MARAFAETERARVDTYVAPIFARYDFHVAERWQERRPTKITKPGDLYLCDDEPACKAFYADCDDAHRAHGFTGPAGHCPALTAERLLCEAERALLTLAESTTGVAPDRLYGDNRKKMLDLLIGMCVTEVPRSAADLLGPRRRAAGGAR